MAKKSPPKARPAPRVVRRHDSIGRSYYIRTSTGERVKKSSWERDLSRREKERSAAQFERARADAEERQRREQKPKRRRREPSAPALPSPPAPFPAGVSSEGVPEPYIDEDGVEWEAHEVDGDDDTGE
jgi:hypothetical protein